MEKTDVKVVCTQLQLLSRGFWIDQDPLSLNTVLRELCGAASRGEFVWVYKFNPIFSVALSGASESGKIQMPLDIFDAMRNRLVVLEKYFKGAEGFEIGINPTSLIITWLPKTETSSLPPPSPASK